MLENKNSNKILTKHCYVLGDRSQSPKLILGRLLLITILYSIHISCPFHLSCSIL